MSDKWEVVTKSKKTRASAAVELVAPNGTTNGTKKSKNTLKMEDIRTWDKPRAPSHQHI